MLAVSELAIVLESRSTYISQAYIRRLFCFITRYLLLSTVMMSMSGREKGLALHSCSPVSGHAEATSPPPHLHNFLELALAWSRRTGLQSKPLALCWNVTLLMEPRMKVPKLQEGQGQLEQWHFFLL